MAYQPIRWDNVPGSSLSEASRPLDAAARAFDMGFGAVRGVLDQRSAIQDQNFAAGRTNATNQVMNRLMSADSVDAFNAAKQGLGAELDGYGAGIDQQAIRNFADQRTGVLQDRAIKTIDFNHKTLDEAQAKDRDRVLGMIKSGDPAQIAAAMKELPGMDLRVKQDIYAAGNDAQRQIIDRAHADDRHKWDGEKVHADITHMQNQDQIGFGNLNVSRGQLEVSRGNLEVNRANAMMTLDERLENRDSKLRAELANTFKNEAGSLAGQAVIDDAIASIKDPDDQKQARIAAAEIVKKNPKASTNAVVMGIKGIDANWAIDMLERSAAARTAAKMDKDGVGGQDAAYAAELRNTLQAKIAANQQRRDSIAAGGFGLGDKGNGGKTTAPAASNTVENPFYTDPNDPAYHQPAAPGTAPASAPAAAPAPKLSPKEQVDADYAAAMAAYDKKYSGANQYGIFSKEGQAERQAIVDAKFAGYGKVEADEKAAKKAAQQAIVDAANKRNAEWMARQTELNAKAATAQRQTQLNKLDEKIAGLQSDLKVYANRGSVRDKIDTDNTNEELAKVKAQRDRLAKLLGN